MENFDKSNEISEDKLIDILSYGPSKQDILKDNFTTKDIVIEKLKKGDIFATFFCVNKIESDVDFIVDNIKGCEIVKIKLNDIQELQPVILHINKSFFVV